MKIGLFAAPYKVSSALNGWRGWRLKWWGLDVRERCDMWEWSDQEARDHLRVPYADDDSGEEYWYPWCAPEEECECCAAIRAGRTEHTHTGLVRGDKPIGRGSSFMTSWRRDL